MKASFGPMKPSTKFEAGAAWVGSTGSGAIVKVAQLLACFFVLNFVMVALCPSEEDGPRIVIEKCYRLKRSRELPIILNKKMNSRGSGHYWILVCVAGFPFSELDVGCRNGMHLAPSNHQPNRISLCMQDTATIVLSQYATPFYRSWLASACRRYGSGLVYM